MAAVRFQSVSISELDSVAMQPDSSPQRPVVLVVDDEKVIADTLVAILNHAGYAASAAYDAESALEMANIVPPELLLTDVVMPGMSGLELAFVIEDTIQDCRVLMFSGQASTVDYFQGAPRFKKAVELLAKPVAPRALIAAIANLLGPRVEPAQS